LARNFPAAEADIPEEERLKAEEARPLLGDYVPRTLEKMVKEVCKDQGDQAERAKILRAAIEWSIAWSMEHEDIDELRQKAQGLLNVFWEVWNWEKIDLDDYTEKYEARQLLEGTIGGIMTEFNDDWVKDYELRWELEEFLDDLASERSSIRGFLNWSDLYENIEKYLKTPAWHSPIITDFLLVDHIDTYFIDLEAVFMLGLFPARVADRITGRDSSFDSLTGKLLKKIATYRLSKAVRKIGVIRSEIASGTYHAKTLIEKLKELEKQDIVVIPSLIYGLLELREGQ
ncbi:MAG: hypothetical protein OXI63_16600, partial [Candidatus Poribacteria bacterium]|nr:hypothetical protein [Candidatus Poribacteria bacterium]